MHHVMVWFTFSGVFFSISFQFRQRKDPIQKDDEYLVANTDDKDTPI